MANFNIHERPPPHPPIPRKPNDPRALKNDLSEEVGNLILIFNLIIL